MWYTLPVEDAPATEPPAEPAALPPVREDPETNERRPAAPGAEYWLP